LPKGALVSALPAAEGITVKGTVITTCLTSQTHPVEIFTWDTRRPCHLSRIMAGQPSCAWVASSA
jgi:hypothetical protein